MNELIRKAISEVPWLLWPALVLLFLWGLLLIVKQLYSLFHQARKNYITELKEHLNFKEEVISDISDQKIQLETQNYELRMEACRKDEIISVVSSYATEKETELKKLKSDTDLKIRQIKFALGTCLWVIQREIFMRRIFFYLLTKSTVPDDIDEFLSKNIGSMIPLIMSDEEICNLEKYPVASDFLESSATILSTHYLQLPMKEEGALITKITNEITTLPSFIKKDVSDQDKK